MKLFYKLLVLVSCAYLFSACAIEGDEISGVWYTNGDLGPMKIEIKPSKGKFVGYLLEYQENGNTIEGGTTSKDLIFDGLEFKEEKYLDGRFLKNPRGSNPCEFKMTFYTQDKKTMRAAHKCNNINRLEIFDRDGYPEKPVLETKVRTVDLNDLLKANPNNKKN